MNVGEIMTRNVMSVGPDTPFKDVVERLVRSEVSSLPVVDTAGALVGLISEADLIPKEAYGASSDRTMGLLADILSMRQHRWVTKAAGSVAADVMTRNVTVCRPDEDVSTVARRMLEGGIKRLPVVEAGVLVGVVSRRDVLAIFDRPDDVIAGDVGRLLADQVNMPDDHRVRFLVDHGVVTLTGDVRYHSDEPIVVSLVRQVPGVIDVRNQLVARQPNPHRPMEPWMFGSAWR